MNLIFLIGTEGSCHHLFKDTCSYTENDQLHYLLLLYFNNTIEPEGRVNIKKLIKEYIAEHPDLNHIDRASFPYKRPIDNLTRFDIKQFYELFNDMENVNLFFIVCVRNIIYSTLSCYSKMDSSKSIIIETKLQEDSLLYINSQIQLLPSDKYIIVDYNNICENMELFEKKLQEKSNMDVSFDTNKIKIPNDTKHHSHKYYGYIKRFFDKKRLEQFSFLENNKTLFYC